MNHTDREVYLEIKQFTIQEAEELLRSKLEEVTGSLNKLAVKRLLTLGYMLLAITKAATFIKCNPITMHDYLATLKHDQ